MALEKLKVLVIGSGGREHALVNACLRSPLVGEVVAAPGNGGMEQVARCLPLDVENVEATVALARAEAVDFVIVGPEVPLALGVADALRANGFVVYGPGADGARLEASKAYCKAFMEKYRIPTAAYARFDAVQPALAYLKASSYPVVVKASGLAAGKGVLICADRAEAEAAVRDMLEAKVFGASGEEIVIEEFLRGEEASIMVVVSGERYVCLPPSQDHKRIGEGDTGLNTGGMGAYAPAAIVTPAVQEIIDREIIEPTLRGFTAEGIDFRGTLFIGLMIDHGRPKVLEYNVRFGDPECQVLLPLCQSDPIALLWDCARGQLDPDRVCIANRHALIIVVAAQGYPGPYPKGDLITFPDRLPAGVEIVHAGTRRDSQGRILSNGGRVLGVVATADSLAAAASAAYAAAAEIQWPNAYYRRDIAWRQLRRPAQ